MGKRRKGKPVNGWINLYKPAGVTSTQAVGRVRKALDAQKAGHGGTLDPLAEGVLPIALGEATKVINFCQDHLKSYRFTIQWGEARSTDDSEGDVTATSDVHPSEDDIRTALPGFTGDIEQTPPAFSAIKVQGERAYDLARAGKAPKLAPRPVYVDSLELLETTEDTATLRALCGKGTYIRALARDIAAEVGTCGYMASLVREAVGPLTAEDAISLEVLENMGQDAPPEDVVLPLETVLDDIPALALNEREAARLKNGQKLSFISRPDIERLKKAGLDMNAAATVLTVHGNKPVALVTAEGPEIRPARVLNV